MPAQSTQYAPRLPELIAPLFQGRQLTASEAELALNALTREYSSLTPAAVLGLDNPYTRQTHYPADFFARVMALSPRLASRLREHAHEPALSSIRRWLVTLPVSQLTPENCVSHLARLETLGYSIVDRQFASIYCCALVAGIRGAKHGQRLARALSAPQWSEEARAIFDSALNEAAFTSISFRAIKTIRNKSLILLPNVASLFQIPDAEACSYDLERLASVLPSVRGTMPILFCGLQILSPPFSPETQLEPFTRLRPNGLAHTFVTQAGRSTYEEFITFILSNQKFIAELAIGNDVSKCRSLMFGESDTSASKTTIRSSLIGRANEFRLTAREVAGIVDYYGSEAEGRLTDPALRYQSLVAAVIGEWGNAAQVYIPFHNAAELFGYDKIWDLVFQSTDVGRREHALSGLSEAAQLCRLAADNSEGRLSVNQLFGSLLKPAYHDSGLSVFKELLLYFELQQSNKQKTIHDIHHDVLSDPLLKSFSPQLEFPNTESVFESWNKLKKFYELLRIQGAESCRASLEFLADKEPTTWRFVQQLVAHPGCRVAMDAITEFIEHPEQFFDRGDCSFRIEQDAPRRPSHILKVPALGISAEQLRKSITDGTIDSLCPLPLHETRFTVLLPDSNEKCTSRIVRIAVEPRTSALNAAAGNDTGDCTEWGEAKKSHYMLNPNTAQVIAQLELANGTMRTISEALLVIETLPSGHTVLVFDNIEVSGNYLKKPAIADALRIGFRNFAREYLEQFAERLGVLPTFLIGEHPEFIAQNSCLFREEQRIPNQTAPRVPLLYSDKIAPQVFLLLGNSNSDLPIVQRDPGVQALTIFDTSMFLKLVKYDSKRWPLTHAMMGLTIGNALYKTPNLCVKTYDCSSPVSSNQLSAALVAYPDFSTLQQAVRPKITICAFRTLDTVNDQTKVQLVAAFIKQVRLLCGSREPYVQIPTSKRLVPSELRALLKQQLPAEWIRTPIKRRAQKSRSNAS